MKKRDELLVMGAQAGEIEALAFVLRAMRHAQATNQQATIGVDPHRHGGGSYLSVSFSTHGRTIEVEQIERTKMRPRPKRAP